MNVNQTIMKSKTVFQATQDEYRRLGNIGMVCFQREEANAAFQDLNETARYIKPRNLSLYKKRKKNHLN